MTLPYETQREIELFLLREAKLLDAGEFESWLSLYAPEGIYWMPSQPGQTDAKGVASIIYEDHAIFAIRVRRLLEARALVLTPMPRTTHLISNIEVAVGETSDQFSAGAAFICVEHKGEAAAALFWAPSPSSRARERILSHRAQAGHAGGL